MKIPYQNFEHTFVLLLEEARREPISVRTFLTALSGKGKVLLLIFLSLGFAQIPGIALILGPFIAYLGVRIAVGNNFIWMPQFLLEKKISSYFLIKIITQILQMLKFMKRWSRPRYEWATKKSKTRVINGLTIALVGCCLAIIPPVPLTGTLACVAIFFIAIGLLNDDGVYILLGYSSSLFYLIITFLLLNYCSTAQMFRWIKQMIPGYS